MTIKGSGKNLRATSKRAFEVKREGASEDSAHRMRIWRDELYETNGCPFSSRFRLGNTMNSFYLAVSRADTQQSLLMFQGAVDGFLPSMANWIRWQNSDLGC